jgi:adenine-specific DNA-methyltransferase
MLPATWWDNAKYSATESGTKIIKDLFGERELFSYPKSVFLVEDCLRAANCAPETLALDFFAGSGTTAHAVMNLNRTDKGNRKYILVEMGEHFKTVILPRVKKVAFSDQWKEGKANGGQGISHFVKYYNLEQYEDTLRRARYESTDAPLFQMTDVYSSYVFLRDLKLLDAVSLDKTADRIEVHPETLYAGIDLAETLSCISGKWIKRITKDTVEFDDGTSASLSDPDWSLIKPLIWW